MLPKLNNMEADRVALTEKLRLIASEGNVIKLHPGGLELFRSLLAREKLRVIKALLCRLWQQREHPVNIQPLGKPREWIIMTIDDKTRTELEAAVFRRLVEHLRSRTDVQN